MKKFKQNSSKLKQSVVFAGVNLCFAMLHLFSYDNANLRVGSDLMLLGNGVSSLVVLKTRISPRSNKRVDVLVTLKTCIQ